MVVSPEDSRTPARAIVKAQIDENLRRIFEEDSETDLPPHLEQLVARLGEVDLPASKPEQAAPNADGCDDTGQPGAEAKR